VSKSELLAFMRRNFLAVQSSVSPEGAPQSAVVGYVVDDRLELFFDTKSGSRKARNLRAAPRVALVIGWDLADACTLQLEGIADEPRGDELARFKTLYFERFPDGVEREAWPDIAYFRVRPTWARFSDFRTPQPTIVEFSDFA
jgi:pyridoxine/pyridoxamine 5'-phosphate oxidase